MAAAAAAASQEKDYEDFDAASFDHPTVIDNEWFPMRPGTRFEMKGTVIDEEGKTEAHRTVFTVTDLTKEIAGVTTRVCWDRDYADDELAEAEIVFFAQANDGTIWQLGEYPEEYEDGEVVEAPCWIHGIQDAKAGILVPAKPELGASFSQGWAPGVDFTDRGVVDKMGVQTIVPSGSYEDVLVIDESNKEEPKAHQLKYYARGVGNVRVGSRGEGDQESLKLVEVEQLSAKDLSEARAAAVKLAEHAREISEDVYALTQPLLAASGEPVVMVSAATTKAGASEKRAAPKITEEQAKEIALKEVPGVVTDVAIERKLGANRYVVEVVTADKSEIDVIIDLDTGKVLATEK